MSALPDRTISIEKRKLRQSMLAARVSMPHASMAAASHAVARHYADHPILAFAPSFSGYIAMRGELDVMPIFDIMERWDKVTSLPCIMGERTLMFRQWDRRAPLMRQPLGTQEPLATAPSIIPALVLVPLLAFDADGYRLGYGAGYYDRAMELMRQFPTPPLFVGVGYSAQEVDRIPSEPHDQPLDGILTELGVSMFG
jgi:5-formyltetrahydrofolate cyclo-ligase